MAIVSLIAFYSLYVTGKTAKMKLYLAAAVLMLVLAVHTGKIFPLILPRHTILKNSLSVF